MFGSKHLQHSCNAMLRLLVAMTLVVRPVCAQDISPAKVAQMMVDACRNKGGTALDNLRNTPPEQLHTAMSEWSGALEPVLGERPRGLGTLIIATKTYELYLDGKFQPAESSKYAARVKTITRDRLSAWLHAVGCVEPDVEPIKVAWFMVRQAAMFDGSTLRPAIADRQLARLRSLPMDAVQSWAQAADVDNGTAALTLVQVDPLFHGAAFQPSVFQIVLPLTEPLIQEIKRK